MATTSLSPVSPPRRLPPALTLIGASRTLLGDQDLDGGPVRWEGGGVEFQPLPCDLDFEPFEPGCGQIDLSDLPSAGTVQEPAVVLWVGTRCSSASWTEATARERAGQLLEVDQHRQLERHFWETVLADAGTTDLSPGGASPGTYALAALQEAVAACGRGFIHASIPVASFWYQQAALRREGGLLLDVFDNVVVPGVGYTGSSPEDVIDATGETAWAYATGTVDTRLGEVKTLAALDPGDNDIVARAQRGAVAYTDECCRFAINVNLCDIACGGA